MVPKPLAWWLQTTKTAMYHAVPVAFFTYITVVESYHH